MSYEKHNFKDGQVLTAEQLNKMEEYFANMSYDDLKDKKFGTEEVALLLETQLTFAMNEDLGTNCAMVEFLELVSGDDTCVVTFNGTEYNCIAVDMMGALVIGNLAILGAGADTGEPFLVYGDSASIGAVVIPSGEMSTATMSIIKLKTNPLDPEYFPLIELDLAELGFPTVKTSAGAVSLDVNADISKNIADLLEKALYKGNIRIGANLDIKTRAMYGTENDTGNESGKYWLTATVSRFKKESQSYILHANYYDNLLIVGMEYSSGSLEGSSINAILYRMSFITE